VGTVAGLILVFGLLTYVLLATYAPEHLGD
jgi:hypothetical protein